MSEIVVLGAGLGGTLVTYELLAQLRPEDRLTLIGQDARYHFVPSNPWVAVGGASGRTSRPTSAASCRRRACATSPRARGGSTRRHVGSR